MIRLVVFLGNPGQKYEKTRHNAARILRRTLTGIDGLDWKEKFRGQVASRGVGEERVWFLEPGDYMNLSGRSVAASCAFHHIAPQDLLVVHDDLEIPFGSVSWRMGGGLGGHNGLRSVKQELGTDAFGRFRLGIGRPDRGSVESWVLGRFSQDQEIVLPLVMEGAAGYLESLLNGSTLLEEQAAKVRILQD